MANENCLKDMACPACQSEDPFEIAMDVVFIVSDDGTEEQIGDCTWDNDSYCGCRGCGHRGTVKGFTNDPNLY